jgi:hypothetical protein
MAANWFVRQSGKVFGPFDSSKLRQLTAAGKITPQTELSQGANGPWAPAGNVKGLFSPVTVSTGRPTQQDEPVADVRRQSDVDISKPFDAPVSAEATSVSSHLEQGIRREKIKTYFDALPLGCAYGLAVIAALMVGRGVPQGGRTAVSVLMVGGLFAIGVALIFKQHREKATEAELDAWLDQDIRNLMGLSLSKVGLHQSEIIREPVAVTGPAVWKVAGTTKASKKGKDGILRFTPVVVTVINFTKDQLVGYSCVLDLHTGKPHSESTDEFFYRDIVAVSTKKEAKKMNVDGAEIQMNAAETFAITTSGGNTLSVFLTDPALVAKLGGGEIPTQRAEIALEAVRTVVREKKPG